MNGADIRVSWSLDIVDRGGPDKLLRQDRQLRTSLLQTDRAHRKAEAARQAAASAAARQAASVSTNTTAVRRDTTAVQQSARARRSATSVAERQAAAVARNTTANLREGKSIEVTEQKIRQLSRTQLQALRTSERVGASSARVEAAYRRQGAAAMAAAREHSAAARMAEQAARREAKAVAAAEKTTAARSSIASRAKGFVASTVRRGAATAAIAASFAAFGVGGETIGFDKSMRNVNSIAQLSEKSLGRLERRVLNLAGPTAQAPQTLAEGLYDLVSSGFNANQSIRILGKTAKAATAGLTDTATSTGAVAAVLNAYRMPASAAGRVSDTLFRVVDRGVISFDQLSRTIGTALPFAATLGVDVGQLGGSIATMTKQGIDAPKTMTRIEAVMRGLIRPSRELKDAYRALGVESGEQLIRQRGWEGSLLALARVAGGSQERLGKLFQDSEGLAGVLALTGRNARSAKQDVAGFLDVNGATDRALSQQSRSISYQWERLKANAKALSIDLGQFLVPAMTDALSVGTDLTKDFFAGLSGRGGDTLASGAFNLGTAMREIAVTAAPLARDAADLAAGMARFVSAHPELQMLAAALITTSLAVKGIRFAATITGISQLVAMLPRATAAVGRYRAAETSAAAASTAAAGSSSAVAASAAARQRMSLARSRDSYHVQRALGDSRRGALVTAGRGFATGRGGAIAAGVGAGALGGAFVRPDRLSATGVASGAAAGAGVGMVAGPWGAAGGALIGAATSGLIGAVRGKAGAASRQRAAAEAKAWADALARDVASSVGRGMDPDNARRLAAARQAAQRSRAGRQLDAALYRNGSLGGPSGGAFGAPAGMRVPTGRRSRAELARIFEGNGPVFINPKLLAQARAEGRRLVGEFLAGQGKKFTTGRFLLQDFRAEFGRVNPLAQQMGATAIVRYASGLERSGRVARGTTSRLISGIARDFDGLAPRIAGASARSVRAVDRLTNNDLLIRRTRALVNRLTGPQGFAQLPRATTKSVQGSTATIRTYLDRLTDVAKDHNAPKEMRDRATRELPGLRRAYDSALSAMGERLGMSRREADAWARGVSAAARRAGGRAEEVRALRDAVNDLTSQLRDGVGGADSLASKLDTLKGSLQGVADVAGNMPDLNALATAPRLTRTPPRRRRTGGRVPRYQSGGMVDVLVSPGEQLVFGGNSWIVPGAPVAADSIYTRVPSGTGVLTWGGQAMMAAGASYDQALAMQPPHFRTGGMVQRFATGGVVRGRVSTFGPPGEAAGETANGMSSSQAGIALNIAPGTTRTGWDNPTTNKWVQARQPFMVKIGSHQGVLPVIDKGPREDMNRAIDVTGAGARKIGIDPAKFPTNSMGTAQIIGGKGAALSYTKPAKITRSRLVDLLSPYGASDAMMQGFDLGVAGGGSLFKGPRGVDSDLFKTAVSGVRPNERDLPKRMKLDPKTLGSAAKNLKGATARQRRVMTRIFAGASEIIGKPYTYGGHGNPGYDCSSAVLYALNRGGLSSASGSTDNLKTWGKAGVGRYLTVGVRGSSGRQAHTMMMLAGRGFESGGSPGAGVHWASGWNGDFPIKRTWPGLRRGGVVSRRRPSAQIPVAPALRRRFRAGDPRLDPKDPTFVGWGMRRGGVVQRLGGGGVAGQRRAATVRQRGAQRSAGRQTALSRLDVGVGFVGAADSASADVIDRLREIGAAIDNANLVTYARLESMRAGVEREIRRLAQGGETGKERIQIRRLRGVLTLLDSTMGKRIGLVVGAAQRAVDRVESDRTRVAGRQAFAGIEEDSATGLAQVQRADVRNLFANANRLREPGGLLDRLADARRARQPALARAVSEQISATRGTMFGLSVDIARRTPLIQTTRAQERMDRVSTKVDSARGALDRSLRTRGIDSGSSAGLRSTIAVDEQEIGQRRGLVGKLQQQAARTKDPKTKKALQAQIDQARAELDESMVRLAENRRALAVAAAQERVDSAQFGLDVSQGALAGLDIAQRQQRTADTSQGMAQRAGAIQSTLLPALQSSLAAYQQQYADLSAIGDTAGARQAFLAIQSTGNEIASAMADAADLIRESVRRAAQDRVDQAQFGLDKAQNSMTGLDVSQRIRRTADTPGGMFQRAQAIQGTLLPALQASQTAFQQQYNDLLSIGDTEGANAAFLQIQQAGNEIASAMADAGELMRNAALQAAQEFTDAVQHGTTMTDLGRQRLELEQRLAGTYETGGQARADYIRSTVIPQLNAELDALRRQQDEALRQGDPVLARQFAEAIGGVQNGILTAQLDAQNEIASNTARRGVGGTVGFQHAGENLTDSIIAVGNGS